MDEMVTRTYRLHVDFTSAAGHQLHRARGVDTRLEARKIAAQGQQADEADGGTTVYRLFTWETVVDRSNLVDTCTL